MSPTPGGLPWFPPHLSLLAPSSALPDAQQTINGIVSGWINLKNQTHLNFKNIEDWVKKKIGSNWATISQGFLPLFQYIQGFIHKQQLAGKGWFYVLQKEEEKSIHVALNFYKEEMPEGSPSASRRLPLNLTGSSEGLERLSFQALHQTLGSPARKATEGPPGSWLKMETVTYLVQLFLLEMIHHWHADVRGAWEDVYIFLKKGNKLFLFCFAKPSAKDARDPSHSS